MQAKGFLQRLDRTGGYLLAIATTLAATLVRFGINHDLEEKSRMMLFVPAVLVSAWYGGSGPGMLALLLGVFMAAWVLIPPVDAINFGERSDQISLLLYGLVGLGIIALAHRERTEKLSREAAQAELERLNQSLEERVRDRTRELEFANRELEGFCYNVSHDLRTPARAIVGNSRILEEDFGEELTAPAREKLGRISGAALKLSRLVDALLVYARLAKAGLVMESINLCELLAFEAQTASVSLGARLRFEKPNQIVVFGDRHQLRLAIEAIVTNAIRYSKPDQIPTLVVTTERCGNSVTVRFQDDGIGFEPQYASKIFEPFERLHRDEEYPGVGMGLANVARIAARHHGSAWAESSVGTGAAIYLRLGDQPE